MDNSLLVIISSKPNGSDTVWNALRLAGTARDNGVATRLFLINDGVDTGRKNNSATEGEFNLPEMLAKLAQDGAEVKYCKTCIDRCGVGEGDMIDGIQLGSMKDLNNWVMTSGKVVTF